MKAAKEGLRDRETGEFSRLFIKNTFNYTILPPLDYSHLLPRFRRKAARSGSESKIAICFSLPLIFILSLSFSLPLDDTSVCLALAFWC